MDNIWFLIVATVIEGTCAVKIARKFHDYTPSWKFYIPVYNVFLYGKFSSVSSKYLSVLVSIQAADLVLNFIKIPQVTMIHSLVSVISFSLWAVMAAKLAVRLGQSFWSYFFATFFSAVASNYVVIALMYIFVPSFNGQSADIPLWAEVVAVIIMSLPFISLAFDKHTQA